MGLCLVKLKLTPLLFPNPCHACSGLPMPPVMFEGIENFTLETQALYPVGRPALQLLQVKLRGRELRVHPFAAGGAGHARG